MHKAKIFDVNVTAEHRIGHPLYIPAAVTQCNSKQIYTRTQNNSNRVSDRNTILYALCTPLPMCTNTNRLATPNLSRPFADSHGVNEKSLKPQRRLSADNIGSAGSEHPVQYSTDLPTPQEPGMFFIQTPFQASNRRTMVDRRHKAHSHQKGLLRAAICVQRDGQIDQSVW